MTAATMITVVIILVIVSTAIIMAQCTHPCTHSAHACYFRAYRIQEYIVGVAISSPVRGLAISSLISSLVSLLCKDMQPAMGSSIEDSIVPNTMAGRSTTHAPAGAAAAAANRSSQHQQRAVCRGGSSCSEASDARRRGGVASDTRGSKDTSGVRGSIGVASDARCIGSR